MTEVLPRKNAEIANPFGNLISLFGFDKEAPQTFRRNLRFNRFRILACPGELNTELTRIGAEDLDGKIDRAAAKVLKDGDCDRVHFFAGGTPGNPHPQLLGGIAILE